MSTLWVWIICIILSLVVIFVTVEIVRKHILISREGMFEDISSTKTTIVDNSKAAGTKLGGIWDKIKSKFKGS